MCKNDKNKMPDLVAAALCEIAQGLQYIYGVEELSETFGVTKEHFIRSFKKAVGHTPLMYMNLARVEKAKTLLRSTDYNLEIVAGLCGFANANYLCKVFKKYTGTTPITYKKG